jgi:hypothetical protein
MEDRFLAGKSVEKYGMKGYLQRHPYAQRSIRVLDLDRECRIYEAEEPRDSMYRVASFLVQEWWGNPSNLADALAVLLLTWNANFYRFGGGLRADALEACLRENWKTIEAFRKRELSTFEESDHKQISTLFKSLSTALRLAANERESAVSCAKALHLLAPNFFPIWDQYIAPAYQCPYLYEVPFIAYIVFCERIKSVADVLIDDLSAISSSDRIKTLIVKKTLLKRIDEYNFVTITMPALKAQSEERHKKKVSLSIESKLD